MDCLLDRGKKESKVLNHFYRLPTFKNHKNTKNVWIIRCIWVQNITQVSPGSHASVCVCVCYLDQVWLPVWLFLFPAESLTDWRWTSLKQQSGWPCDITVHSDITDYKQGAMFKLTVRKCHHSVSKVTEVTMIHRLVRWDPLLPLKLKFKQSSHQNVIVQFLVFTQTQYYGLFCKTWWCHILSRFSEFNELKMIEHKQFVMR